MVAAAEALGPRGISVVSRSTGVSRRAIRRGMQELRQATQVKRSDQRIRDPGGGRKEAIEKDPTLRADLERLIEPTTRGDPESPLRWTCRSVRQLAQALRRERHPVSHQLVSELLEPNAPRKDRVVFENSADPKNAVDEDRRARQQHRDQRGFRTLRVPDALAAPRILGLDMGTGWAGCCRSVSREDP